MRRVGVDVGLATVRGIQIAIGKAHGAGRSARQIAGLNVTRAGSEPVAVPAFDAAAAAMSGRVERGLAAVVGVAVAIREARGAAGRPARPAVAARTAVADGRRARTAIAAGAAIANCAGILQWPLRVVFEARHLAGAEPEQHEPQPAATSARRWLVRGSV